MILNLHQQNRNLKAQIKLYHDRDTSHELSHEIQKAKDAHYEEIIELKEEENEALKQKLKKEKGIRWGLIGLALLFLVI